MSDNDSKTVKPPQKSPVATTGRKVLEAVVEELPGGSVATALGHAAFPSAEDKDRGRWEEEITGRINDHSRALHPEVTFKGCSAALALWMAKNSTDGLHEPFIDYDKALEALGSEFTRSQIEEAAEDLESFGLVRISKYIGGGHIMPTWRLFFGVDHDVKGWDLEADARTLTSLALELGDSVSASELEMRSGFDRRRFNPAFSKLLTFFDDALISKEIQPDYAARHAFMSGGTRSRLRRFLSET